MSVKENVLELLRRSAGNYVSGEALAQQLDVSRTAVWKAVRALQTDGCDIDAGTNRGYCLAPDTDVLSAEGICQYLHADGVRVEVQRSVSSTNTLVKQRAAAGEAEVLVLVADSQSAGRGRLGRSFYSPAGTGIYMSFLLRPPVASADAQLITTAAAVAVAGAIEEVSGRTAQIKWVNDIFVDGKKVCGILTEAAFDMESGFVDWAVPGIGINAYAPMGGYPPELADIAGAVFAERAIDLRCRLAAAVIDRFMAHYAHLTQKTYLEEYRRRSCVVGKRIFVVRGEQRIPALATGIDDECHLLVRYDDGSEAALSTGEISIRLQ